MVRKFYDTIIDGNGGDPTPGGVTAEAVMEKHYNKNLGFLSVTWEQVIAAMHEYSSLVKDAALAEKDKEIVELRHLLTLRIEIEAKKEAAVRELKEKMLDEFITKLFWQRKTEFIHQLNMGYDTWKEFNDNIRFYISKVLIDKYGS